MTKEAWSLRNQHALQSDVLVKQPLRDQHYLGDGFKHFYFPPYLGKWSNWTNIFQMGWNHHPDYDPSIFFQIVHIEKSEPLPPLLPDDWSIKASPSRSNCSFVGFRPPILFLTWIWSKLHCSPECVGRWNHFESSIYLQLLILSLSLYLPQVVCAFVKVVSTNPPRLQPLCQALHHDPRAKCLCQQIGLHPHRRCGSVNGWMGEVWGSIEIFPIPFYFYMVFSWTLNVVRRRLSLVYFSMNVGSTTCCFQIGKLMNVATSGRLSLLGMLSYDARQDSFTLTCFEFPGTFEGENGKVKLKSIIWNRSICWRLHNVTLKKGVHQWSSSLCGLANALKFANRKCGFWDLFQV